MYSLFFKRKYLSAELLLCGLMDRTTLQSLPIRNAFQLISSYVRFGDAGAIQQSRSVIRPRYPLVITLVQLTKVPALNHLFKR
jgi:hypothetical protein